MSATASAMSGKTVLVTGATGGIGLETARSLARMGAAVVMEDLKKNPPANPKRPPFPVKTIKTQVTASQ